MPNTGPQINADATEPDGMADHTVDLDADAQGESGEFHHSSGDDDEHPFTAEDYATAATELAAEAEAADANGQIDHNDAPVEGDDEVQALRRENARRRVQSQETDAENQRLSAMLTRYHRDTVERTAASTLVDPKDLWRVAQLADVLTDDGTAVDERKVRAVIAERIPQHWAKPKQSLDFGGYGSGATGRNAAPRPTSWASAIGPASE
jgi:hypothetical protein